MSNRLENNKVASRYAKALFESTAASGESEVVSKDLTSVNDLFNQVSGLMTFLENPAVALEEKQQFLDQQFSQNVSPWVLRLLKLLVENQRVAIFSQLVEQFNAMALHSENAAQAEVVSATELEEELKTRIRKTLESTFGFSRVDLQNRVDPGLLGGVIIKLQDRVIDGSYVGRLEEMRKQFSKI
jgi:F-type H+-transporting ATPase subunit delta